MWKKGWNAKGFGFTLKNCDCDFDLRNFIVGAPESFDVHYGKFRIFFFVLRFSFSYFLIWINLFNVWPK